MIEGAIGHQDTTSDTRTPPEELEASQTARLLRLNNPSFLLFYLPISWGEYKITRNIGKIKSPQNGLKSLKNDQKSPKMA